MTVREGARQTMAWLHGWMGLLLGWVLYVMSLAGTLSVFRSEIGQWMRPETRAVAPPAEGVAAAVGWLEAHATDAPAWFLVAPSDRANTVEGVWLQGARFVTRSLDPVTGIPAVRETLGGDFFYRLHFELQLPYPWGRMLAALAAAFMLVALITGIIAHRRFFRDFFTFRPGRGQRAWLDAHNALGVLALPFHIMITVTGLVTLATLVMPWGAVAKYGSDMEALYHDFAPGAVDRPAAKQPGKLAPVLPMLREAERRFGGGAIGRVTVTNPGDAASVVIVLQSDAGQFAQAPHTVSFDGTTGRVLADWAEVRPAVRTYNVTYGLHMARFAPTLLRWLYFVSGLALSATIASGMVLWIVKRRARAPLVWGNRLADRLNVAVLAGTPLAFAAMFCANRFVPLATVDRGALEVSVVMWTWGGATLAGLLLPPRRGWPILLVAGAIVCIVAVGIDIVLRPWPAAYPDLIGVSAVLLGCGLSLLAIARGYLRGKAQSA